MGNKKYNKPHLSSSELLELLKKRNLTINDEAFAEHVLRTVGYYRLSGYFKPYYNFSCDDHEFLDGTTLEKVWNTYVFDRRLRIHTLDAIERIEIALRSAISNTLASKYGILWYRTNEPFKDKWIEHSVKSMKSQQAILEKEVNIICTTQKEEFIKHYYNNYDDPEYPPGWMMVEAFHFGTCTNIFDYLLKENQLEVIKVFGNIHPNIIKSFLRHIRYIRNICAHHGRLWNKTYVYRPKPMYKLQVLNNENVKKYYGSSYFLHYILLAISPGSKWKMKLKNLMQEHTELPYQAMGFQVDWESDRYWD